MLHGFAALREEELAGGLERNIHYHRNEVSPFLITAPMAHQSSGTVLVDEMYGQAFDSWIEEARGIYGETRSLPEFSGDQLANMGYLRIPYRRIPRRLVRDRRELDSIVGNIRSADPDLKVLFRGQGREYLIGRDRQTLDVLYGDPEALEPSLLPSASRRRVQLEEVLPEWCALIQVCTQVGE